MQKHTGFDVSAEHALPLKKINQTAYHFLAVNAPEKT